MATKAPTSVEIGTYELERETKNFLVYSFTPDEGRKVTQYVAKADAEQIGNPDTIVVSVSAA